MPHCATRPKHSRKNRHVKLLAINLVIFLINETFRLYNIGLDFKEKTFIFRCRSSFFSVQEVF